MSGAHSVAAQVAADGVRQGREYGAATSRTSTNAPNSQYGSYSLGGSSLRRRVPAGSAASVDTPIRPQADPSSVPTSRSPRRTDPRPGISKRRRAVPRCADGRHRRAGSRVAAHPRRCRTPERSRSRRPWGARPFGGPQDVPGTEHVGLEDLLSRAGPVVRQRCRVHDGVTSGDRAAQRCQSRRSSPSARSKPCTSSPEAVSMRRVVVPTSPAQPVRRIRMKPS